MLDTAATNEQAARRAGIAEMTPMKARLEIVAKGSPTSANTRKPLGMKKARKVGAGLAAVAKEVAERKEAMQ